MDDQEQHDDATRARKIVTTPAGHRKLKKLLAERELPGGGLVSEIQAIHPNATQEEIERMVRNYGF